MLSAPDTVSVDGEGVQTLAGGCIKKKAGLALYVCVCDHHTSLNCHNSCISEEQHLKRTLTEIIASSPPRNRTE